MNEDTGKAKTRTRVERNIYTVPRQDAKGRPVDVFQVGYRDSSGRQRWHTMDPRDGITAARAWRDDVLGRKGKGETVAPNPKVRFSAAADAWLDGPVSGLRENTQAVYRGHVETHLRPRWGTRRLDAITPDHVNALVAEMRAAGKSEWTITGVIGVAVQVYRFARVRMGYRGDVPTDGLLSAERPKGKARAKRRIYSSDELGQVLRAAHEPYRTLFVVANATGARVSEIAGLTWADVGIDDTEDAEIRFEAQVSRKGERVELKTEESRRTLPIPATLAVLLAEHKLRAVDTRPGAFVFATRSGRALSQRNIGRELRRAQRKATDEHGRPTFPVLHELGEDGAAVCIGELCRCKVGEVAPGELPTFHSFRHTAASVGIAAGDTAEDVAWQLGHKDANVTRAVYVHEIKDADRRAKLRARMEARNRSAMEAARGSEPQETADVEASNVRQLRQ